MSAPYSNVRDMLYELKTNDQKSNSPDTFHALSYLKQATARIDDRLGILFQPRVETRHFDPRTWRINSNLNWLVLPNHLFSVSQVTDGNGVPLDPAVWFPTPVGVSPFHTIQLVSRSAINPFGGAALSFYKTINAQFYGDSDCQVTGIWGWHQDYANALVDSLDFVMDNPLTPTASLIHVNDVSDSDIFGRNPRFSPGQLLKIEDEYVELAATSPGASTLSVLRGQNGTAKAQHNQNTPILMWEPPAEISRATARFACFPYKRRGDFNTRSFDTSTGAATTLPRGIPGDVMEDLQAYANGVPDGGWTLNNVW